MLVPLLTFIFTITEVTTENDLQFLNELPLDKLIRLKSSLQEFVTHYDNVTTAPTYLNTFGAQAMALNAPLKRTDYEVKKDNQSKLSKLFTMSVTTLAFLAFGGYLLCLIVQAVKAKQSLQPATVTPTFVLSSGIKKKPHSQFASYGRRKRDNRFERSLKQLDLPPEQMFDVLLKLCEGYAKWSERYGDTGGRY